MPACFFQGADDLLTLDVAKVGRWGVLERAEPGSVARCRVTNGNAAVSRCGTLSPAAVRGVVMVSLSASRTARSRQLRSWRTLPDQSKAGRASIAAGDISGALRAGELVQECRAQAVRCPRGVREGRNDYLEAVDTVHQVGPEHAFG